MNSGSRLSVSSTGCTDGGTELGAGGGGGGGGGGSGTGCGAGDGCYADDSSEEGSNSGDPMASGSSAEAAEPAMPEEVFKWMTHTVNEDFIRLGYPTILTKTADQEFVSLCPLIRNCSAVLTLLKARRRSSVDAAAAPAAAADSTNATAASGGQSGPAASLNRRKRRRWGLFSSGGKQQNRRAAGGAARQSAAAQHQQPQHQQPQQHQSQQQSQSTADSLHESMARKMRRDTERIIRRTGCLDARALHLAGLREPAPFPEGSAARNDFAFVRSTWRSFRKLAQAKIVESGETAKRIEELQRQLTEANSEVERLRSAANSPGQQHQQAASSSASSSQETGGRLQRVGGFLRRAVSRERLTFGRSSSRLDASTTTNHHNHQQQQQQLHQPSRETRSRASSQPPPMASAAVGVRKVDSAMEQARTEFERRERLLLTELEKLRRANSKLTFRIQYLSGLASAAAKQQHQQQQQAAGGSVDHSARTDRRLRKAERKVADLQREASTLRKSLDEQKQALTVVAKAATHLKQQLGGGDSCEANAAAPGAAAAAANAPADQAAPTADEPAKLATFIESVSQMVVSRLQRLQRQCTEAEARVAALTDCLRPAAAPSPAPSAALNSTPSEAVEAVGQAEMELTNRILNHLSAMGLVPPDEKPTADRAANNDFDTFRHQQQKQQRRARGASHDPRRSHNSMYFY